MIESLFSTARLAHGERTRGDFFSWVPGCRTYLGERWKVAAGAVVVVCPAPRRDSILPEPRKVIVIDPNSPVIPVDRDRVRVQLGERAYPPTAGRQAPCTAAAAAAASVSRSNDKPLSLAAAAVLRLCGRVGKSLRCRRVEMRTVLDEHIDRAFHQHCALPLKRPITARRVASGLHERRSAPSHRGGVGAVSKKRSG